MIKSIDIVTLAQLIAKTRMRWTTLPSANEGVVTVINIVLDDLVERIEKEITPHGK